MDRRQRDIRKLIQSLGCGIVNLRSHKGHLKATITTPSGAEVKTTFSGSPSDWRVERQRKAQLQRLITQFD